MPFRTTPLELTEQESQELRHMAASRALPASDVFPARLILLLAAGRGYAAVKRELHTTAPTIARWKQRFLEKRIDGLVENRHPECRPTVITPQLQTRVRAPPPQRPPRDGATHWSCRKLARELGLSKDAVHRIWRTAGLKPHRLERYMASNDPDFERKAADILGLYLDPPQHAAVFYVDEKSAIQVLDRLDPVLPLSPGRLERHGFEYTATAPCRCTLPLLVEELLDLFGLVGREVVQDDVDFPFCPWRGGPRPPKSRRTPHWCGGRPSGHAPCWSPPPIPK